MDHQQAVTAKPHLNEKAKHPGNGSIHHRLAGWWGSGSGGRLSGATTFCSWVPKDVAMAYSFPIATGKIPIFPRVQTWNLPIF